MKISTALVALGVTLVGSTGGSASPPPDIRPVRTIVAVAQDQGEPVSLTGHIRARIEANLAFRIDGKVIARRAVVGQIVHPGDVVAELDPQPQQDALRAAKAQNQAAQAALHEATNNLERIRKLLEQGWVTQAQFDAAQKTYLSARAQVDATAAQLHSAEDQLGYTKLLADSSGSVTTTGAEVGEVVRAGQMIVTVAQDNGVDGVFDVPASLMRQVSPDTSIDIALTDDPSVHATGRVREVAPQADPVTRSYRVKIGLKEWPKAMRLGATVTGQTRMRATPGIELPATALTAAEDRPAVWVFDPKTQVVSLRPVELGSQGSSSIVIMSGIEPGEIVVTAGVHSLRPGQKVRQLGAEQ